MPSSRSAKAAPAAAPENAPAEAATGAAAVPLRMLKKYPNRRLYDTQTSSYITLADVKRMVLEGQEFEVVDAKSGQNLTRSILLQIILEEESGGLPMFSSEALAQIIRFYGHAMQGVMGTMIEKNLQAFAELQGQFMNKSAGLYDPKQLSPELWAQFMGGQAPALQNLMGNYVEQSKAMFEQMQKAGALFPGMPGFTPPKR